MRAAIFRAFSLILVGILSLFVSFGIAWALELPTLSEQTFEAPQVGAVYEEFREYMDRRLSAMTDRLSDEDLQTIARIFFVFEERFAKMDQAFADRDQEKLRLHVRRFQVTYRAFSRFLSSRKQVVRSDVPPADFRIRRDPIPTGIFWELGIRLDPSIPTQYLLGETLHISGTITSGETSTLLFLMSPDQSRRFVASLPAEEGRFSYSVALEETGTYSLVVASGQSFQTTRFASLRVSDPTTRSLEELLPADRMIAQIERLHFRRENFSDLQGVNLVSFTPVEPWKHILYTLELSQNDRTKIYRGMGSISIPATGLSQFASGKNVRVRVYAQRSATNASIDIYTRPALVYDSTMLLQPSYVSEREIDVHVDTTKDWDIRILWAIPSDRRIQTQVFLIRPDGSTHSEELEEYADTEDDKYLRPGANIDAVLDTHAPGVYLVELNYDTGFAAINVPIVIGDDILPIAPNTVDRMRDEDTDSLDATRRASLSYLNALRAEQGLGNLRLSDTLNELAQIKAQDMADHGYVGHVDSTGVYINGTAKRFGFDIDFSLSENVAGGNVGYGVLISALSLSGGHRANMLWDWTSVGIGIVRRWEQTYYVQVFSDE